MVYGLEVILLAKYVLNIIRRKRSKRIVLTRRVVVLHILAGAGAACLFYGYFIEPHWVDVNVIALGTAKLKNASFRIIQISDLHCDSMAQNEDKAIRLINDLEPDIIVATGDYLNHGRAWPLLRETLRLLDAPLGKFAIVSDVDIHHKASPDMFAGTDFQLLYEDGVTVAKGEDSINVWGLSSERSDACRSLLDKIPANAFNVLLVHTPDWVEDVSGSRVDLYLCGHTHGGQIRLPVSGALFTNSKFGKKYESGLYRIGETTLYVNRGLGIGPRLGLRVRFLAKPEIAVFDIFPQPR